MTAGLQSKIVNRKSADHLGSTSLTTDASGDIIAESRYHPFGEERWSSGVGVTDFGFTSQRESNFGLMDYNARFYSVSLGRFVSADTIVPNPGNPQSLNRYSYVYNRPLNFIDPSGHEGCNIQEWNDCFPNPFSQNDWEMMVEILKFQAKVGSKLSDFAAQMQKFRDSASTTASSIESAGNIIMEESRGIPLPQFTVSGNIAEGVELTAYTPFIRARFIGGFAGEFEVQGDNFEYNHDMTDGDTISISDGRTKIWGNGASFETAPTALGPLNVSSETEMGNLEYSPTAYLGTTVTSKVKVSGQIIDPSGQPLNFNVEPYISTQYDVHSGRVIGSALVGVSLAPNLTPVFFPAVCAVGPC